MRGFEAEGIEFAFPSRTVFLANDDRRQVKLQVVAAGHSQEPKQPGKQLGNTGEDPAG